MRVLRRAIHAERAGTGTVSLDALPTANDTIVDEDMRQPEDVFFKNYDLERVEKLLVRGYSARAADPSPALRSRSRVRKSR